MPEVRGGNMISAVFGLLFLVVIGLPPCGKGTSVAENPSLLARQPSPQQVLVAGLTFRCISIPKQHTEEVGETGAITPMATPTGFVLTETEELKRERAAAEEEEATRPMKMRVTGKVINASGGKLPEDLAVTLLGYEHNQAVTAMRTHVERDGSFIFPDVDFAPGRMFLASVRFNAEVYYSEPIQPVDLSPESDVHVPIFVYETTNDTSVLVAERVHIYFDFIPPDSIQVVELFVISNRSEKVVVPDRRGEPLLEFELPDEAVNLTFHQAPFEKQFVKTIRGFGDTRSIPPGKEHHQVMFTFELPYKTQLEAIFTMPLAVETALVALPAGNGAKLYSNQLRQAGSRTMHEKQVQLYSANALPAGSRLELRMIAAGNWMETDAQPWIEPGIWIGGGVLLLAVAAIWLARQRRKGRLTAKQPILAAEGGETADALLDAIVALDDLYHAGELPEAAYRVRRAALKERLRQMLENLSQTE